MLMTPHDQMTLVSDAALHDIAALLGLDQIRRFDPVAAERLAADDAVPDGQRVILLHDPRTGSVDPLALQASARAGGSVILFVEWLADRVRIGPLVGPDTVGCLACRDDRRRNNLRGPVHAAGSVRGIATPSPMAMHVIAEILASIRSGALAERVASGYVTVEFAAPEASWHRFVPMTACIHCDDAPSTSVPETAPAPMVFAPQPKLSAQHKRVPNPKLSNASLRSAFVDRECGIVKHLYQDSTSALLPLCVAEMSLPGEDNLESGYGRAETSEASELVAILEAVERYAGHRPRAGQSTLHGSYHDMQEKFGASQVTDPACFILHAEEQYTDPAFHLQRYSPGLPTDWCWGHSQRKGHAVLVPQQLVYYRTPQDMTRQPTRFLFDSSNGTSLGGCPEEAILGGLYEVVERDAYLTTWYSRHAPRRIAIDSVNEPRSRALIERSLAEGYEIHLFDISTDTGIPAVWGMIVDPSDDAVVKSYCASASHGRWDEAIFSALVEITTSMGVYRQSMKGQRDNAARLLADPGQVRQMSDHVLLFSHPETYRELAFLHDGETLTLEQCRALLPDMAMPDLTDELASHIARVMAVADDVIIVDQSFAALEPLNLSCVKVLVPGLLPVTFGHQNRRVSPERVSRAARARGYAGPDFDRASLNPFPHNFP